MGNTLKSQDYRKWLRVLPLKPMECGKVSIFSARSCRVCDCHGYLRLERLPQTYEALTMGLASLRKDRRVAKTRRSLLFHSRRPSSPFAAYMLRQSIRQSFGFFCPITARSNPACLNIALGVHPCSYRLTAIILKSSWYVMNFSLHLVTLPVCSMASICSWVTMRLLIEVVWITRAQNAKKWTLSCPLFGGQIKSECCSLRMLATPPTRFKPMRGFIR